MPATDLQNRLQQALGDTYSIERELGGGGMSRVFVAGETALGRKVVIKVLRSDVSEALSGKRFKREVRVAAQLQHPHIVPLLAAGEAPGEILFYTMPFVEGESLRQRLEREGGLPVADTVRILCEVAGALAYAHRLGVVHRDIKPENILLADGGAVVADFGIAKAISASRDEPADAELRRSSTLTAAGTSLGTPGYMAPEQATGDVVDHRTDLYALGVVAYEMLAGRAPFEGRSAQQLMAAHATQAPEPIERRRSSVPAQLATLTMQLLEKNPADRPQSADEVRRVLQTAAVGSGEQNPRESSPGTRTLPAASAERARRLPLLIPVGVALLGGLVAGAMLLRSRGKDVPQPRSVIAALAAPAGRELRPDGGLALSADDTRLAFTAVEPSGATAIWIRHLDSLTPSRVEGTEGASGPFWSPDGSMLGYFAGGQLRVMDLQGGSRRVLCPAPRAGGGAWTAQGLIVYSPDFLSVPLFKVSAAGGPCTALTSFRGNEAVHRRPYTLPGGRHILFSSGRTGGTSIVAVDLTTGVMTDVLQDVGEALFVAPDWMLYRQLANGAVYAQRLDLETLKPSGAPRLVLDRVVGVRTLPSYAASPNVLVALQMTSAARSLVWVDRKSVVVDSIPVPGGPAPFFGATSAGLAHDGRRIAFAAAGPLWLFDRDRRIASQAQTGIVPGQGILEPDWSPGDSLIAYRTLFSGTLMLRLHHLESDTSDSLFSSGMRNLRTPDWSPDGKRIAFQLSAGDSAPNDEIWIYSLLDKRATRAWAAAANLSAPRWSPDGQWLAYVSDEIGAPEVFVRRVSGSSVAMRVSNAGGDFPSWRADGRELYYRAPDGAIMAVQVTLGTRAVLSPPSVALVAPPFSRTVRSFEVTPDGQRFVGFGREDPLLFTLVTNWPARVR